MKKHNMKKHNMKQLLVESRGMVPLVNGEAASSGDAALATNVRAVPVGDR